MKKKRCKSHRINLQSSDRKITLSQLLHKGFTYIDNNQLTSARKLFNQLAKKRPSHPDVLYGLARVAWINGQKKSAIGFLSKSIKKSPLHTPFYILLGDWYIESKQTKKAIDIWHTAILKGLETTALDFRLIQFEQNMGYKLDWWSDNSRKWTKARKYIEKLKWEEAISLYKQLEINIEESKKNILYKEAGTAALNAGDIKLAKIWLMKAVNKSPNDSDILLNLGNISQYENNLEAAEEYYNKSIKINNQIPESYNNLAVILKNTGRLKEAKALLKQALNLNSNYAGAWNNLGLTYQLGHDFQSAEAALRKGLEISPNDIDLNLNLGALLGEQGKKQEAKEQYKIVYRLAPKNVTVITNLGVEALELKKYDLAKKYFEEAIEIDPTWVHARNNLAALYMDIGRHDMAIDVSKKILDIDPEYVDGLNNMGISYRQINRLGEAKNVLEKCLSLSPDHKEALSNLAFVKQDLGCFDDALKLYRRALTLDKKRKIFWDNYLFCSNYHPTLTQEEHIAIYKFYDSVMGSVDEPFNIQPHIMIGRKLRIAYFSGDLRKHPQQYFFMPFLDHHNRNHFEVFCYHNGVIEDDISKEMIQKSDGWRRIAAMTAKEVAKQVVEDKIDIMIDLAGHTGGNRSDIYPYRAAPVQISTLLGWNFGVGLSCMDALIGDNFTLPEGTENFCVEPILRVPCNTYICRLDPNLPYLLKSPAKKRGYITFGTTTRTVRLNENNLTVWADILCAIPNSHLHFNSRNFKDPTSIARMSKFFEKKGIAVDRLEFDFTSPIYLAFKKIDIYLDTFPHNNGTTLIEALWYGLPVITKVDRPPFGCIGQAVLHYAGLHEWIAHTKEDYINIAKKLALNWDVLENIRADQRSNIANTALFDEASSVNWFEQAYVAMYQKKLEEMNA